MVRILLSLFSNQQRGPQWRIYFPGAIEINSPSLAVISTELKSRRRPAGELLLLARSGRLALTLRSKGQKKREEGARERESNGIEVVGLA